MLTGAVGALGFAWRQARSTSFWRRSREAAIKTVKVNGIAEWLSCHSGLPAVFPSCS